MGHAAWYLRMGSPVRLLRGTANNELAEYSEASRGPQV